MFAQHHNLQLWPCMDRVEKKFQRQQIASQHRSLHSEELLIDEPKANFFLPRKFLTVRFTKILFFCRIFKTSKFVPVGVPWNTLITLAPQLNLMEKSYPCLSSQQCSQSQQNPRKFREYCGFWAHNLTRYFIRHWMRLDFFVIIYLVVNRADDSDNHWIIIS